MRYKAKFADPKNYSYEIYRDPVAGFYLYVYSKGKCVKDYLQDTLDIAIEQAREGYGVPEDSWVSSDT